MESNGEGEGMREGERGRWKEGRGKDRGGEEGHNEEWLPHCTLTPYPQYPKPLEVPSDAYSLPGMTGKGFQHLFALSLVYVAHIFEVLIKIS